MKINLEVELTPEELRRFMGLPDVGAVHTQLLEQFTQRVSSSPSERDEFLRTLVTGAMAPWQNFFNMVAAGSGQPVDPRDK